MHNIEFPALVTDLELFFPPSKIDFSREREEVDGSDGTREDTTMFVQIEDVKSVIRTLPFVTKLSSVGAHNGHGVGWGVSLT